MGRNKIEDPWICRYCDKKLSKNIENWEKFKKITYTQIEMKRLYELKIEDPDHPFFKHLFMSSVHEIACCPKSHCVECWFDEENPMIVKLESRHQWRSHRLSYHNPNKSKETKKRERKTKKEILVDKCLNRLRHKIEEFYDNGKDLYKIECKIPQDDDELFNPPEPITNGMNGEEPPVSKPTEKEIIKRKKKWAEIDLDIEAIASMPDEEVY